MCSQRLNSQSKNCSIAKNEYMQTLQCNRELVQQDQVLATAAVGHLPPKPPGSSLEVGVQAIFRQADARVLRRVELPKLNVLHSLQHAARAREKHINKQTLKPNTHTYTTLCTHTHMHYTMHTHTHTHTHSCSGPLSLSGRLMPTMDGQCTVKKKQSIVYKLEN